MPRGGRLLVDGALYHAMTRGNQKQPVFLGDADYKIYLGLIKKAKRKYGASLYAYCLMPNHTHLLIDITNHKEISKFMHCINRGYTALFNKKYGKVGHLWQGRFKSKPIMNNEYLINCAEYIETNPVRAGLVKEPGQYRWSSYRERCLLTAPTVTDDVLCTV